MIADKTPSGRERRQKRAGHDADRRDVPAPSSRRPSMRCRRSDAGGLLHRRRREWETFPFQLINNHIYADVKINGKGPYTFIFDTGGVNLVTPTAGEGTRPQGRRRMDARGGGTGTMSAGHDEGRARRYRRGDDHRPGLHVAAAEFDGENAEGMKMPGMIGSRPSAASSPASTTATRRSR